MEQQIYPFRTFTEHHWNPELESDVIDATRRILERPPTEWHDPSLKSEATILNGPGTQQYLELLASHLPNWDPEREGVAAPETILKYFQLRLEMAVHANDLARIAALEGGAYSFDLEELISQAHRMRTAYLDRKESRPHTQSAK